jgi:hypothetical protein
MPDRLPRWLIYLHLLLAVAGFILLDHIGCHMPFAPEPARRLGFCRVSRSTWAQAE